MSDKKEETKDTALDGEFIPGSESVEEGPKKRGRPKGSTNSSKAKDDGFEPVEGEEKPRSTRGRPKGGAKKSNPKELAKSIAGIHQLLAMVTGLPELIIEEREAEMLANAITNVSEQYGFQVDGKTGAAIQLFGAAAMVYGPRVLFINARMAQAQAQQQAEAQNGAPFNTAG